MKNLISRKFKFHVVPPHFIAFLTGVLLALVVGVLFRKIIDKMNVTQVQYSDPAQKDAQTNITADSNAETTQPTARVQVSAKQASTKNEPKLQAKQIQNTPSETTPKREQTQPEVSAQSHSDTATAAAESQNSESLPHSEAHYDRWRELLRIVERNFVEKDPNARVMLTPRYRHNAKGLAITRGQFLDIVSNKAPANLPTRPKTSSVIFHSLATDDFEPKEFSSLVSDSNTAFVDLCKPSARSVDIENTKRVTVLLENTNKNLDCLSNLLKNNPRLYQVNEFGIVAFTRGVTYFASVSAKQKLFSLQMWNPDWLLETTVGLEENHSKKPALGRAQRLANVARALSQPSDVRIQIPASFRSIHGPALDPVDPTPPRPLILGNFALIPSHMPRGSLVATAYMSPDLASGRSVTTKLQGIDKTKALVLATQGKSLQFMKVSKD